MNGNYTLIGFLDLFGIKPNFVFPVFKKNKEWFFQDGSKDHINDFVPVKDSVRPMLIPLSKGKIINVTKLSHPIYAFIDEFGKIEYGDSFFFSLYFMDYKTDDSLLKKKISDFLHEIEKEKDVQNTVPFLQGNVMYYGTGRRKSSVARVYITPNGSGMITVNGRDIDEYFGLETLKLIVRQPLVVTNMLNAVDIRAVVVGGGVSGQAGAIRHGIARALLVQDDNNRAILKSAGFLTRDSRMKERKKYGCKAARRSPQYSKR